MKPARPPRPAAPRVPRDRPYVVLNMAMTADGKIATANRVVESFGSERDHAHLLDLRASVDAVLCGARTASAAGVTLGTGGPVYERRRRRRGLRPELLRVVVSGNASLSPEAGLFRHAGGPVIILTRTRAPASRVRRLAARANAVVGLGERDVDLAAALRWLRREQGVRRLVCEGGGALNDAMFRAGLIDEVHLTVCPRIFGGRDAPTIAEGTGFARLADAARLRLTRLRCIEGEAFLQFRVVRR